MSDAARVLIVDDQEEIQDLTSLVLTDAGYATTAVSSGRDALRLLAEETFDLVLLDINMPEMDGWQTLRLLRADDELERLPVVMFSVKGEVSDKVHSLQEGATGYITKPFVVDELVRRVGEIVAGPSPSASASAKDA